MRQDLIDAELRPLLEFSRSQTEEPARMDSRLMRLLADHPRLAARVEALRKIDGVGPVTALSWALEVGDPSRRFDQTGREFLRVGQRVARIGGSAKARAFIQAAQSPLANGAHRGVQNRRAIS